LIRLLGLLGTSREQFLREVLVVRCDIQVLGLDRLDFVAEVEGGRLEIMGKNKNA